MLIAVVIPCYKVSKSVLSVISTIPDYISHIIVVDDACPENSGQLVQSNNTDPRTEVLFHAENGGVGAAVVTGYKRAMELGVQIVVKIDGDGQMDPTLIADLIKPIQISQCDYTKGNRFFDIRFLQQMPRIRLIGNAFLSLFNKVTSGYWNIMDPTNGFTAIETRTLSLLDLNKLERRYFFESDMLYHLGTIRAVVNDIPMQSRYADETSNLQIGLVLRQFPGKLLIRFCKRVFYSYFLRDFNAGTMLLTLSALMLAFSITYGGLHWYEGLVSGQASAPGVVMLAALPFLVGMHLLISAINWDIGNVPKTPLHPSLRMKKSDHEKRA